VDCQLRWRTVVIAAVVVIALVAVALAQLPDGKLHVYFLDVGQGMRFSSSRRVVARFSWMAALHLRSFSINWRGTCRSGIAALISSSPRHPIPITGGTGRRGGTLPGRRRNGGGMGRARPAVLRWSQLMTERHPLRIPPQAGLRFQIEPG